MDFLSLNSLMVCFQYIPEKRTDKNKNKANPTRNCFEMDTVIKNSKAKFSPWPTFRTFNIGG